MMHSVGFPGEARDNVVVYRGRDPSGLVLHVSCLQTVGDSVLEDIISSNSMCVEYVDGSSELVATMQHAFEALRPKTHKELGLFDGERQMRTHPPRTLLRK